MQTPLTLNHQQILGWPSCSFAIAAGQPGRIVVPLSMHSRATFSGAYGNVDGVNGGSVYVAWVSPDGSPLLIIMGHPFPFDTVVQPVCYRTPGPLDLRNDALVGAGLAAYYDNANLGNLTGGAPDNSFALNVEWKAIDAATGLVVPVP